MRAGGCVSLQLIPLQTWQIQSSCHLCVYVPPDVHGYVRVMILPFNQSASSASVLTRHILLENCFVPFFSFSPHTSEVSDDEMNSGISCTNNPHRSRSAWEQEKPDLIVHFWICKILICG